MSTRLVLLLAVAAWVLCPAAWLQGAPAQPRQPNIVLIMVDDLGKEWIGCYGAEDIETPHIDKLAEEGLQFEKAYCMPQCTPTRVTLLTGQYPFHHGWTNHFDVPRWGSGCHFDPQRNASFPRVLRQAGYKTAIAGKWQIDDFRVEPGALDEAGFDAWCVWTGYESGNPQSGKRYQDPYIYQGNKDRGGESRTHEGKFGPDVYCDFLIDFAKENRDKPLLLYYPMCLTHTPLIATPDDPGAEGKLARHKAMVRYTDKLAGRLVAGLDAAGLREDTIILFTTDNGSTGGIQGTRNGRTVAGAKAKMVEAGTAVPLIVNCPGRVPEGKVTEALTDFTDILPTFADLAGTMPNEKYHLDGKSIAPVILGRQQQSDRDWILSVGGHPARFRHNRVVPAQAYDDRVIRDQRWKLWVGTDRKPQKLFDLQNDPAEAHNLIDSNAPAARAARQRLMAVIAQLPEQDAAPRYRPNPEQPWDRFPYEQPEK